jgi:hypothetical protein
LVGFPLLSFLSGWIVGWIQTREPLLAKLRVLEKVTVPKLVEDLKWSRAKVQAQESDLKRMNQKLEKDSWSGMDLPQQNMSYWRVEGPKLKQRVLDLEMELESLRSKTVWKE